MKPRRDTKLPCNKIINITLKHNTALAQQFTRHLATQLSRLGASVRLVFNAGITSKYKKGHASYTRMAFLYRQNKNQCSEAASAPIPVCERTSCSSNASRSACADGDLSVTDTSQMVINAANTENSAGYLYGKIGLEKPNTSTHTVSYTHLTLPTNREV